MGYHKDAVAARENPLKLTTVIPRLVAGKIPITLDIASTALQNFGQSAVNRSKSGNSAVEASRS